MASLLKTAKSGLRSVASAALASLSEHPLAPYPFLQSPKGKSVFIRRKVCFVRRC